MLILYLLHQHIILESRTTGTLAHHLQHIKPVDDHSAVVAEFVCYAVYYLLVKISVIRFLLHIEEARCMRLLILDVCTILCQDMARKKASEAQEREAQESAENVNDESTVAAEKTETVDDKNDKTQSRGTSVCSSLPAMMIFIFSSVIVML